MTNGDGPLCDAALMFLSNSPPTGWIEALPQTLRDRVKSAGCPPAKKVRKCQVSSAYSMILIRRLSSESWRRPARLVPVPGRGWTGMSVVPRSLVWRSRSPDVATPLAHFTHQ